MSLCRLSSALLASWLVLLSVADAAVRQDIVYGEAAGEPLLLDAHVPDGPGPFPIAILVHGGGWSRGDKSGLDEPSKGADITPWFTWLSAAKFTWFSINYRLAPKHRWPACFEDLQSAIRWVKTHAADFKGDPRRIALFGHSSGGHLVCLAGALADEETRVQAIVGFAPVTDLEADAVHRGGLSPSLQNLLGRPANLTPDTLARLRELSPITHAKPGLPPVLLLHGDADRTVPFAQSTAFQARLHASGGRCDLPTIPDGPHGLVPWSQFAPDYPERMIAWLRDALGPSSSPPKNSHELP
ncbi:MAG TPA: alpha/beta hydrolase [Opitutus sp.]|nr:alpha/beta hydrolase [Opitutus sp.]